MLSFWKGDRLNKGGLIALATYLGKRRGVEEGVTSRLIKLSSSDEFQINSHQFQEGSTCVLNSPFA